MWSIDNFALLLLLSCLHVMDCNSGLNSKEIHFPNKKQGDFFRTLNSDYSVVVPERVTDRGNFESHHLNHRVSRRSVHGGDQDSATADDAVHYRIKLHNTAHDDDRSPTADHVIVRLRPSHGLLSPGMVVERWRPGWWRTTTTNDSYHHPAETPPWNGALPHSISRMDRDHCLFRGTVLNQTATTKVALSTCNGLMGFLHVDNEIYFIEPLKGHEIKDGKHPHLVYKRSALPFEDQLQWLKKTKTADGTCGSPDSHSDAIKDRERWELRHRKLDPKRSRRKRSVSVVRNVETLAVADKMMVDYYSDEDIRMYILTIFNMVSELYRDATIGNAINIVLVRFILIEDDEQEKELKVTHHADNSLKSFCKWQQQVNPKDDKNPNHHDVAILITRYNICTRMNEPCSTLGLAEVAGMCQPHRSCNINEDSGLALAYTVAHELGHNFGMNHDGPQNGCEPPFGERQHVMSPHLNSDTAPFAWSNCSRSEITKFLDRDWGSCLDDEPADHEFSFPDVPPGVMYNADHQCRLQNGLDASHCDEITQDVCTSLWCRLENKCITRLEPAAPGTHCGPNKWCFNGQCTVMGDRPQAINGEWGEWSEWSLCSRTCGAGVSHSERLCNNPLPQNGGRYCIGERRKYKICNTEPCPEDTPSFRAVQCSSFNSIPYKDNYHTWVPVSVRATPCQLHCKPDAQFVTVLLADTVIDGTPCNPGTRDMCINGKCRRVACDLKIDSEAQEDRCGICHGDGTQCQTIRGEFNQTNGDDYVEVVVIPAGSRGIRIEERLDAANFIAIRDGNGTYRLNGNWLIQWSGDYDFPGTIMYYKRDGEVESLYAPGRIKEDMHVMLLFQSSNPGLKYEYTVPNANATRKPEFQWEYTDWSICTVTCGGGVQTSTTNCMEKEAGLVEDKYCDGLQKLPDMSRPCNVQRCPSKWWYGPWQHCSVTCGNNGHRRRTVICTQSYGKDEQIALHDSDCEEADKPTEVEPCHHKNPCPGDVFWKTGNWSDTCNGDPCNFQTRDVQCSVTDGPCDFGSKPVNRKQCGDIVCGNWITGSWSECSRSCGSGVQFRRVTCEGGLKCLDSAEPLSIQTCERHCESNELDVHPATSAPPLTYSTSGDAKSKHAEDDNGIENSRSASDSHDAATSTGKEGRKDDKEGRKGDEEGKEDDRVSPDGISTTIANPGTEDVKHVNEITAGQPDMAVRLNLSPNMTPSNSSDIDGQPSTSNGTKKTKPAAKGGKSPKPYKRPHGMVVDKVDPTHVKGVEIQLDSEDVSNDGTAGNKEDNSVKVDYGDYSAEKDLVAKNEYDSDPGPLSTHPHRHHHLHRGRSKNKGRIGINNVTENIRPKFEWIAKQWSECTIQCSGGLHYREVACYETTTETLVDSGLCSAETKPVEKEICGQEPCVEWQLTDWSECSHSCGDGHKTREVWCPKTNYCNPDTRPKHVMPCFTQDCVKWVAGPWSHCSVTCGSGSQTRHVKCINVATQASSHGCNMASKPSHRTPCSNEDCLQPSSAKLTSCIDKLESSLCASLRHMCSTWYFKVKCCHTCRKQQKADSRVQSQQHHHAKSSGNSRRGP